MTADESARYDRELDQLQATIAILRATPRTFLAESVKLTTENRWCLRVVGSGATLADHGDRRALSLRPGAERRDV